MQLCERGGCVLIVDAATACHARALRWAVLVERGNLKARKMGFRSELFACVSFKRMECFVETVGAGLSHLCLAPPGGAEGDS